MPCRTCSSVSHEGEWCTDTIARLTAERDTWKNEAMLTAAHQRIDNYQRLLDERDAAIARAAKLAVEVIGLESQNAALLARAERAERVIAEALRRRAHTFEMDGTATLSLQSADGRWQINVAFDGTDADLYRALVAACEGGRDG